MAVVVQRLCMYELFHILVQSIILIFGSQQSLIYFSLLTVSILRGKVCGFRDETTNVPKTPLNVRHSLGITSGQLIQAECHCGRERENWANAFIHR